MRLKRFQFCLAFATTLKPVTALVSPTTIHEFQTSRGRYHNEEGLVTQLGAVTVVAESDRQFTITPIRLPRATSSQTAAWPRRLMTKVLRRDSSSNAVVNEYVTRNDYSSQVISSSNNQQRRLITIEEALGTELISTKQQEKSSPLLAGVTSGRAETILATLFHRWTQGAHKNLQVHCDSSSGVIDLVKGIFRADATIQFDQLSFGAFQLSSGALKSHRLAINLYKFAPFCNNRIPRFASMFDLEAQDAVFTQKDLFDSTCIRHGLRRLLTMCLQNRGFSAASKVEITAIQIVSPGKLSISGSATTPFGSKLRFEVRSGLGLSNRGHVLTFPGLEIAVGPSIGLFMPVVPPISLDMGHNAKITSIHLNGEKGTLELSCKVTITPRHTRKLADAYEQDKSSYAAPFHFDVGRWLTRLGRFSE